MSPLFIGLKYVSLKDVVVPRSPFKYRLLTFQCSLLPCLISAAAFRAATQKALPIIQTIKISATLAPLLELKEINVRCTGESNS